MNTNSGGSATNVAVALMNSPRLWNPPDTLVYPEASRFWATSNIKLTPPSPSPGTEARE